LIIYEDLSFDIQAEGGKANGNCRNTITSTNYLSDTFEITHSTYEGVSKSSRIGRLERELQMVQLSATRRSCIAIL